MSAEGKISTQVDNNGTAALKINGVEPLRPPGIDSNYIDWSLVVLLHLRATNLAYVLDSVSTKERTAQWRRDDICVCSIITKTVLPPNLQYIRNHIESAELMWIALKEAHQDTSAGSRMYWLRRLILYKMENDDMNGQLEEMNEIFEKLNALISPINPLTADNIYSAALLIAIPSDWSHVVSHLLDKPNVQSTHIVACLKAESNRRASTAERIPHSVASVSTHCHHDYSSAGTSSESRNRPRFQPARRFNKNPFCSYCKIKGHDLSECRTASRILSDHRKARDDRALGDVCSPKAGKVEVVGIGCATDKDDSSDDFAPPAPCMASVRSAVALHTQKRAAPASTEFVWNIDSGCSITMTPHNGMLSHASPDSTLIKLADDSRVTATAVGNAKVDIDGIPHLPSLLVPGLQEPLLSVAAVCDQGYHVVFTSSSCTIYKGSVYDAGSVPVGNGYREGNLYYMASKLKTVEGLPEDFGLPCCSVGR